MDTSLTSNPDLWSYIAGISSPFDTNAGVNPPAAQNVPVTTNLNGTSSVSPSWLDQLGGFLTGAAKVATPILQATGVTAAKKPATTTPGTASAAFSSLISSPLVLIGIIGGGLLVLFLIFRRN